MKTKTKGPLITSDFYGTVILKDWICSLDDRQVKRLEGLCTVVHDEALVGFKTRGAESNWAIRVVGRTEQWTVLGCQVRAVVAHAQENTGRAFDGRLIVP